MIRINALRIRRVVVFEIILFVIGLLLLVMNIGGLFFSLRHPDIYKEPGVLFPNDISLTYEEALQQIKRLPDEGESDYLNRLTSVINASIAHYWPDDPLAVARYRLRVPIWENYLLWFYSFVAPKLYYKYEYFNYRKALERGVGFCSQQAMIETFILNTMGIPAKMVNLNDEHVVLQARVGGKWLLADPDFGVVIPYDIAALQKSPETARSYYAARGHTQERLDQIVWIYSLEGYYIYPDHRGYKDFQYLTEVYSYFAIWVIPLLLVIPSTIRLAYFRKNRSPNLK